MPATSRTLSRLILCLVLLGIAGCSSVREMRVPNLTDFVRDGTEERIGTVTLPGPGGTDNGSAIDTANRPQVGRVPSIARASDINGIEGEGLAPEITADKVDAFVPPLELPAFVEVVFGQMLSVPYVTGQGVAARTDIVQLRSSGEISSDAFLDLVKLALADFGVRVIAVDGIYQIVEDEALKSQMPRFILSRARRDTPASLRPVVQFVQLNAISASNMSSILRQAFGERQNQLRIEPNQAGNYIVLSGLPDDVDAAIGIIDRMDELQYAGTDVLRYSPNFWDAKTLSDELSTVLQAEGWQSSTIVSAPRTVLIIPIEYSNTLFAFTRSPEASARVRYWLSELDRPAQMGDVPQLFIYTVQNVDAQILAQTVNAVLSGNSASQRSNDTGGSTTGSTASSNTQSGNNNTGFGGRSGIVVDPMGNRLIYSGTPSDYERLLPLLRQLDQPPAEVLIEVVIAEVTLSDTTRYGVEWAIDSLRNGSGAQVAQEGIGVGSGGFDFGIITGDVEAAINAFARNSQVEVLSKPHIVARSGGAAQIQVGSDVPIITSQRAAATQDGSGGTDVLQSVDYRSTGVLLSIEPIVFGNNRIDLKLTQEVSTTLAGSSSGISSPTISSRNITTALSLDDGSTAVIGGLIQDNVEKTHTGIPVLKDIPGIGNVFSNKDMTLDRTELVVLITAYVLSNKEQKANFAREFSRQVDETLNNEDALKTRALPW